MINSADYTSQMWSNSAVILSVLFSWGSMMFSAGIQLVVRKYTRPAGIINHGLKDLRLR